MGKGRGCAREEWEERSSRKSGRERAQVVEGAIWETGKTLQRKNGKRNAVEGRERKTGSRSS